MTFQHPEMLWGLVALIPLGVLWRFFAGRRERRLEEFVGRETWPVLNRYVSAAARRWKTALFFTAIAFAVVAAARPLWGTRERLARERGIDLIVAIDVSKSMLARDVEPTRLEHAKRSFRQLLASFSGHRIGIVPFAGEAFLQCPLTSDYGIALDFLEGLDTDVVGVQGTNLAAAIERANEAFGDGGLGQRVMLIITDGEDHEGKAIEAARQAAESDMTIFALGIGSPDGAPVFDKQGNILEDKQGHKVNSRLDIETLRQIAELTGGHSYIARPGEGIDVSPLVSELSKFEQTDGGREGRRTIVREERFQYPLAVAVVLLLTEALLGDRKRGLPRGRVPAREGGAS